MVKPKLTSQGSSLGAYPNVREEAGESKRLYLESLGRLSYIYLYIISLFLAALLQG